MNSCKERTKKYRERLRENEEKYAMVKRKLFETAHGKVAVNGVGGAVKRAVWRAILQDRAVIGSAEEFARVAESECLKVNVIYIPKGNIAQAKEQLLERWNACLSIPETHSIHYVTKLSDTTISVAKNSQFLK